MNFNTYFFHDAIILSVHEYSDNQKIDFLIDYPSDWTNNKFENKILRFIDVTYYLVKELPFAGCPTILEIQNKPIETTDMLGNSVLGVIINTNAGYRELQYKEVQLLSVG